MYIQIGALLPREFEDKIRNGEDVNVNARLKIEKRKAELEQVRIAITKDTDSEINDLKHNNFMVNYTAHIRFLA